MEYDSLVLYLYRYSHHCHRICDWDSAKGDGEREYGVFRCHGRYKGFFSIFMFFLLLKMLLRFIKILFLEDQQANRMAMPDHEDKTLLTWSGGYDADTGRVIVTSVPLRTSLSIWIEPPYISTIRLQTTRPRPVPFSLEVTKGRKMWSSISWEIPSPLSTTLIMAFYLKLLGRSSVCLLQALTRGHFCYI